MEKKRSGGINIGTSLILVTFVLLALVTFAALSYMSAKSDYTLSLESAERTTKYYDANRRAELYMANIEGLLSKYRNTVTSKEEYYDGIEGIFSDNDEIRVEKEDGKTLISYTVAVTEGQNLEVSLVANYPGREDDALFHISKWATKPNEEWLLNEKNKGTDDSKKKLIFNVFEKE